MAALKPEHKLFIVQMLACYFLPSEIAARFKDELGLDMPTSQIARYNPASLAGETLSDDLRQVYMTTRASFLKERESIAIAQANFRLRELEDMYRTVKGKKNFVLAAQMLEQAAKEEGGLFRRIEKDVPTGDPNAIPKSLDDAVEKIYGEPQTA